MAGTVSLDGFIAPEERRDALEPVRAGSARRDSYHSRTA